MGMYKVKSLNYSNESKEPDKNNVYFEKYSLIENFDDTALMTADNYKKIFGKKKSEVSQEKKLISILRIKSVDTGKIIRRKYMKSPLTGISKEEICISPLSISLLSNNDNSSIVGQCVEVSKGNIYDVIRFYWDHPFHATRISYRVGLPSLLISIISLLISFFSIY